ncbi:unnamed protein product, partial [Arabidopsis halleri]
MCSLILHGRRLVQLQKWCHLSFSVQKASSFSTSDALVSTKVGRKGEIFTVSYLVDSLGLTRKLAESISEGKANPESVLSLLTSHGFTDSQISSIITIYPRLFLLDAKKSLAPKLKFLQSRGASSSELTEIVSKVPEILAKKGDKTLSRYYDFVKVIVEADKSSSKYEKLCHSLPVGNLENKIRNISVLRELGVPQRLLFPLLISSGGPVNGKERFGESIKKLVEMGFDPTTTKFVKALRIVQGLSEKTMEEKANLYKSLGFDDVWEIFNKYPIFLALSEKNILNSVETFLGLGFSRDEFANMVKSFPQGIGLSAETIKKKIDFLVKKMNWPLKALVSNPAVLGYNMEKRIVPRCNVIKALMSKGLLGDTGSKLPPIGSVLKSTNQVFFKRRSVELQKWRNLRVSVPNASSFFNLFSSATAAAPLSPRVGRKGKDFTFSYLVDSLGLPKKLAESISKKVSFEDKGNPDSVLNLFRSHGFTDSQISSMIGIYPRLLILDPQKSLGPKLQFLQSREASSFELTHIVSKVPEILGKKGDKTISVYYDFIKDTLHDKSSKYEKLCHSFPPGNLENKIRNVSVLRELGMPHKLLFSLLISDSQPVCGKEKFEGTLKKVVEMGFDPTTGKFVEALNVIYKMNEKTIEERFDLYKSLGFDVGDVWSSFKKWPISLRVTETKMLDSIETFLGLGFSRDEFAKMVKHFPPCIGLSPEMVKKKTEFLVKKMNWPLKALVSNPAALGYSLEKRTVPRGNVIKALMS